MDYYICNSGYFHSKEGGTYFMDFFAISAKSTKPELAALFINFINEPKWAALNATKLLLPTPNLTAKKYIPKDILNNPLIYPDPKVLQTSEFHTKITPENGRIRATIFTKVHGSTMK